MFKLKPASKFGWRRSAGAHTSMKLVSLSTGKLGEEGALSGAPTLLARARSSSTVLPLSLMRRRRLLVLYSGTLERQVYWIKAQRRVSITGVKTRFLVLRISLFICKLYEYKLQMQFSLS